MLSVTKISFVGLILLCLILALLARESSLSFQKCESEQEAQTASEQQIKNISVFIKRVIAGRCTAEFVRTDSPVAAILLTIITGGLLWIGYMQIVTTRGQLRAYLFAECTIDVTHEGNPIALVRVHNSGATPAYKMIVISSAKTFWAQEVRHFDRQKRTDTTSRLDLGSRSEALNAVALSFVLGGTHKWPADNDSSLLQTGTKLPLS